MSQLGHAFNILILQGIYEKYVGLRDFNGVHDR